MIHFVQTGGPIPVDHLSYLIEYFHKQRLQYVLHDNHFNPVIVQEKHAYVSCDMNINQKLAPVRKSIFQVQLAHNLSGLKGSAFWNSSADLNILPGRRIADSYSLDLSDPRFVISGYPKWDFIYHERFLQKKRRQEIASSHGLNPDLLWVCFYPTGPNEIFKGNLEKAFPFYERLWRDIGDYEFIICDHARNREILKTQQALKYLKSLARENSRIHVVDGYNSLPYISACDLFISDIASSIISAISMHKPIVFISIEHEHPSPEMIETFQCGIFLSDSVDVREFIQNYEPSSALWELFASCVNHDDDKNCERITKLILERYNRWHDAHSCQKKVFLSRKLNADEVPKLKRHQRDDLVVVVKPTNRCNASCLYCANKKGLHKKDLEIELLRKFFSKLSEYAQLTGVRKIIFLWHGGEPLLMGKYFYTKAWKDLEKQNIFEVKHLIQTNLLLLDVEWVEIFKCFNVGIGTSVDPIGNERIKKDGCSQYPDWLEKFILASEGKLRLGIVFTVLSRHLNRATDIYNFFKNLKSVSLMPFSLRINPVYAPVKDTTRFDPLLTIRPNEFGDFLYDIWKLWDEDGRPIAISPLLEWSKGRGYPCEFSGSCHQHFLSVDSAGDIYHCGRFADTHSPLGNILDTELIDILSSRPRLEFQHRSEILKTSYCQGCHFWQYCKGGCPFHAYIYFGDIFHPSPFCQGYKRFFQKIDLISLGLSKEGMIDA